MEEITLRELCGLCDPGEKFTSKLGMLKSLNKISHKAHEDHKVANRFYQAQPFFK